MSIPYLVRKKVHFQKGEKQELWYAVPKKMQKKGGKTEKDIARLIAQRTGFHRGMVEGVITEMAEMIEEVLSKGALGDVQRVRIVSDGAHQQGV